MEGGEVINPFRLAGQVQVLRLQQRRHFGSGVLLIRQVRFLCKGKSPLRALFPAGRLRPKGLPGQGQHFSHYYDAVRPLPSHGHIQRRNHRGIERSVRQEGDLAEILRQLLCGQ